MSESVTLIAGILLISVGLLALLPYLLNRGWRAHGGPAGERPAIAAVGEGGAKGGDLNPLLVELFSLRMTVSELAAEVQEVHAVLLAPADDEASAEAATPV